MSVDATERLQRLLSVFPLFAERAEISLAELERSSGVDSSTLLEDLAAITERSDEPGGFISSVAATIGHSHVSMRTSHFLRPMRLNVPELCALELGLAMLAASSAPDEQRTIASARERVRAAIVATPAAEQEEEMWRGVPPASADGDLVATLRAGVKERRKVRMAYRRGGATESAERVVHGYGLIPANDTWYLIAHCEVSEGIRFFRLDRVEEAVLLDERFRTPSIVSVKQLVSNGRPFHSANADVMTVRYSPRIARWIAERERLALAEDGSLTLEHPLADVDWAVRHVLQYGPDAEVIGPAEVRKRIRSRLQELAG